MASKPLCLQARSMATAIDARKAGLRSLQTAADQAARRAQACQQAYMTAKGDAEAEQPVDEGLKQRLDQLPEDL